MSAVLFASDVIARYGHGEVRLTGWGGFWLLLFVVALMGRR